jgi:lipoprotein-releasing system permease protein
LFIKIKTLNVAAFIAKRIAFNQQRSFSRFIIRLAIAATIISVAAMIVTVAFTNGFQYAVGQKVFSFLGDIRVQHYEAGRPSIAEELPITKNDTVLQIIRADKDIKTVQAFATKHAIVKGKESVEGILLKGVEKDYDFSNLNSFLQSGRWLNFTDSGYSNEVDLSVYTANQLKLKVNDKALIYFIQSNGSYRVRPIKVAGIFKTGIEDYDKLYAIGDIKLIQRLNDWKENQIGGYEIFVTDRKRLDTISSTLFSKLPDQWNAYPITQIAPNIFDWLNLQDQTITIVFIIMIIIATLNLVTCLIILVLERTQMVGILKAIGSPNHTIQNTFLYHGAMITITGIFAGNILGLLICWLQQHYGIISLPEDAYFISKAVVKLNWMAVVVIDVITFIVCFLVLLIPSLIIRNIRPTQAIRFK